MSRYDTYDKATLHGAIKARCYELGVAVQALGPVAGMSKHSIHARLSISRGKRALQPWQVSAIAARLGMDETELHRLAAQHEGWKV